MPFSQFFSVLSGRAIKIIAVLSMTIDHIGFILFPDILWLRYIGRAAFPLFAFLIAHGCIKTRNIGNYFLRLIAFAVFIQILWVSLGFIDPTLNPGVNNIFFTLASGVGAVWLIRTLYSRFAFNDAIDHVFFVLLSFAITFCVATIGGIMRMDYGMEGILLIASFYAAARLSQKHLAPLVFLAIFNLLISIGIGEFGYQWFSMLAILFIWMYKDTKQKAHFFEKYAFYIYYPLHFLVLCLIALLT